MDPKPLFDRFKRKPTAPPSAELASALAQLDRLGTSRPELLDPSRQLGRLLAAGFSVPGDATLRPEAISQAVEGWAEAKSAFSVVMPDLGEARAGERFRALLEVGDDSNPGIGPLRAFAGRKGFDPTSWSVDALSGRPDRLEESARQAGLDPLLVGSMLRLALLPALARLSKRLEEARTGDWDRGDCPNCASRPLLAESRGLEQRIVLRCGLCASEWPWERLRCPSCGENTAKALHYSFVEGEQERYRLAHCDTCRWDWKVVASLGPISTPGLIVADLASIHLDLVLEVRKLATDEHG